MPASSTVAIDVGVQIADVIAGRPGDLHERQLAALDQSLDRRSGDAEVVSRVLYRYQAPVKDLNHHDRKTTPPAATTRATTYRCPLAKRAWVAVPSPAQHPPHRTCRSVVPRRGLIPLGPSRRSSGQGPSDHCRRLRVADSATALALTGSPRLMGRLLLRWRSRGRDRPTAGGLDARYKKAGSSYELARRAGPA